MVFFGILVDLVVFSFLFIYSIGTISSCFYNIQTRENNKFKFFYKVLRIIDIKESVFFPSNFNNLH